MQSHVRLPISTTFFLFASFVWVVMCVKKAISLLRTPWIAIRGKIVNRFLGNYDYAKSLCFLSPYFKRHGSWPFIPMPIFSHAAAINSNLGCILANE
jgi:hypothetical protein